MTKRRAVVLCVACAANVFACGTEGPDELAIGRGSQAFVNGNDDRREYFELSDAAQRAALERFTLVLMAESTAQALVAGETRLLPTWGEIDQLCPDQAFFDQPSAAFCSGVLLDWNLVLTSGHCIDALPLEDLRVVFNYFYRAPDELAVSEQDVYGVRRVVASRRDPQSEGERLDFAWLELRQAVRPPHEPARAYTRGRGAELNEPVISIGAGGGVPLKVDIGGQVRDIRSDLDDYLIADTDTSQGSSGGALFDMDLAVVGSLARGAVDFSLSDAGCYVTNTESDPRAAQEQFTYVHRAVEALCEADPTQPLCESDCEQPCASGAPPDLPRSAGCSLSRQPGPLPPGLNPMLSIAGAVLLLARRRRSSPARHVAAEDTPRLKTTRG